MFEQDYLMRMLVALAEAIRRSMEKARGEQDFDRAAQMIETAIGTATDIDGEVLLSLAPESMASVLQVSGTDPAVMEYLARSLLLESTYLERAGKHKLAELRSAQAFALAESYDFPLALEDISPEAIDEFFGDFEDEGEGSDLAR